MSGSGESAISKIDAWGLDLQVDISNKEWNKVCKEAQTNTANTNLKLLHWLMRTYITPVKLLIYITVIYQTCVLNIEKIKEHSYIVYVNAIK